MSVFADMTDRQQQPSFPAYESNVVDLSSTMARRKAITDAVRDYCGTKGLEKLLTQGVIDIAIAVWINGCSPAAAIEEGRKSADEIAKKMKPVRARLGLRDDDGPRAA